MKCVNEEMVKMTKMKTPATTHLYTQTSTQRLPNIVTRSIREHTFTHNTATFPLVNNALSSRACSHVCLPKASSCMGFWYQMTRLVSPGIAVALFLPIRTRKQWRKIRMQTSRLKFVMPFKIEIRKNVTNCPGPTTNLP